ncbi:MAG: TonB-dependent receptor plug domain-containing protein [Balneolaceae bacterium]|nr:TonB-dependent receptor plug domain-containing protein [Balneolaceae bacterium]
MTQLTRASLLGILALSIALAAGCAATGGAGSGSDRMTSVEVTNPNIPLADYLRRAPGVTVQGSGANVTITIQGSSSFYGSSSPLFYIDDTRIGRDYNAVRGMVNMNDVSKIQVVKGAEASSYGLEGSNGVIIIHTKRASQG